MGLFFCFKPNKARHPGGQNRSEPTPVMFSELCSSSKKGLKGEERQFVMRPLEEKGETKTTPRAPKILQELAKLRHRVSKKLCCLCDSKLLVWV